jgi:hypothetical protein
MFKKKIIYYIHALPPLPTGLKILEHEKDGWYRKFEKRSGKANLKRHKR